jgi:hypothetical protein
MAAAGAEVLVRRTLPLVLLALPLAGCGGSNDVMSIDPVARAAATSASAHSMKVNVITKTSLGLGSPFAIEASGVVDNDTHRVRMSLDMSSLAGLIPGTGSSAADYRGEEVADFAGGKAVVYMNMPFMTKLAAQGKPWVKIDLAKSARGAGLDVSQFTQISSDPSQLLDYLRATSGEVKNLGTETIDGVRTTHYRATVDLEKYPELVPPAQRAQARAAVAALRKVTKVRLQPVDVWIGDDKLVRKLHESFTETIQAQEMTVATTTTFHDFNVPVRITIPRDSQTADLSQLTGGG